MKKYFQIVFLVLILFLCSACNGTITRNIRHAGFSIGSLFECSRFYPQNKEDVSYEKILYFTGAHLINREGKIYEISLSQPFSNKENCREANTDLRVNAIMDDKIIRATDGKYYYLVPQNNVMSYTEIPVTDNSYSIYDILLKDADVMKVISADSSVGLYYVLKTDGNVYGYSISTEDRHSPPFLSDVSVVYAKSDFGSRIIDFNYAGNSLATFLKTEDKIFRMRIKNKEECSKYVDIVCEYEFFHDTLFDEYREHILTYNGSMLITDYKQTFSVGS